VSHGDLLRDPWIPLLHGHDRSDHVGRRALGPRRLPRRRKQAAIFPVDQRAMQAHERGGLQDDRGPDQAAGGHEEGTQAGDQAIRRPEIGRTVPGPIEDQRPF